MLEIANRTPFPTQLSPSLDKSGLDWANVAVKGTFTIARGAATIAEEQLPIWEQDIHWGDPATSSVRYASDLGPQKPGTDVALLGHAYAEGGRGRAVDVGIQVGTLRKVLRVHGDRRWFRCLASWTASAATEFDRMPLVWERAFGGRDETGGPRPAFEPRNPVGTGYAASASRARLDGLALPNLEDLRDPITAWDSRPAPACFGFVGPHWSPRSRYAGTYDEAWQAERLPHLPLDFDERFHNAAVPELVARPHLVGGERVAIAGACAEGPIAFALPAVDLRVTAWIRGRETAARAILDTVVIEPDDLRVSLTWRASFPCPRRFLQLEAVVVRMEKAA